MLKLNCDLGESYGAWVMGNDAEVMPLIDAANIACGFHGGDPSVIRATLAAAAKHNVEIGAHVSYPDLQGFGRRSMQIRGQALADILHYQIAALSGMARLAGTAVTYVKPHGALYNDMMKEEALLTDIMTSVAAWPEPLALVILGTGHADHHRELAERHGVRLEFEAFADRAYTESGELVPRSLPGAVLHETDALTQARELHSGVVTTMTGKKITVPATTLCVHGDTPDALAMLRKIRAAQWANT